MIFGIKENFYFEYFRHEARPKQIPTKKLNTETF